MKKSRIKRQSSKKAIEEKRWRALEHDLHLMNTNRSEYTGKFPTEPDDWVTCYQVEYHHIRGRRGKRVYDPFNVIALTPTEHKRIEDEIDKVSEEELESIVRPIRINQAFEEDE